MLLLLSEPGDSSSKLSALELPVGVVGVVDVGDLDTLASAEVW